MSELPENWIDTTLGEIALWGSGGTPNRNISEYYGGKIPWFKTGELNEGIITEAEEYLTEEGLKNSSAKIFPKGSIMIAMYGATIGKCAVLGIDGSTNQACAVAQPKKGIEPLYLFHYVRSQKQNFIEKGKGGAQPNISQTVIKEHPIPLPPLPEQKRIVAKLDTLFAHLDQLKARLQNIPTLLKQFRQAVLTQAVTGKLTQEWRENNPFIESIDWVNQIKKNRGDLLISEKKWSKGKDRSDDLKSFLPDQTPTSWAIVSWGEIGLAQNGKSFPSSAYTNKGIKLLRPGNLHVSGKVEWSDKNTTFLPVEYSLNKDYIVGGNEIVMNLTAQSLKDEFLGRVCITNENEQCLLNQRQARIKPVGMDTRFCFWLFKASPFRRFVDQLNTGTLIQHMYTSQLDQFEFAMPPLKEQKEIVRRVESLFAVADRIEASYHILQEKIDHLPQAILSKAFRGELTLNKRDN